MKLMSLIVVGLVAGLMVGLAPQVMAVTEQECQSKRGQLTSAEQAQCSIISNSQETSVEEVVTVAINILAMIAGVAAVIVMIVQGLRLIFSAGNSESINQARRGIIYSIIGIVVVIFARQIILAVLARIS